MTDLTEQWKKGELPERCYYIRDEDGQIIIAEYFAYCINKETNETEYDWTCGCEPEQVLAPVPSYEEWKAKDVVLTSLLAEYGKLTKELQDEKEKHITRPSLRSPIDEMVIEKQVWESTLHRSMVLEAENAQLKESIHSMLFTDDVVQDRYDKAIQENTKLKELLKECRDEVKDYIDIPSNKKTFRSLIAKINQALGVR